MSNIRRIGIPDPEREAARDALMKWATKLQDGQRVAWVEVTQGTGVQMNPSGRALLRLVLRRLQRRYRPIPGKGFEMSSPDNAVDIVGKDCAKVVNATILAKQTTDLVIGRHLEQIPQEAKNRLLQTQATLSTLQLSVSLAKRLPEGPSRQ